MVYFTVAIPTYNGAKKLPLLLDKLQSQSQVAQLNWEVLVVDNNSQDNTCEVIREYQEKWSNSLSLRYVFEKRQGAAFARQHAIETAQSELVGFLDDDVLPNNNWVAAAYQFAQQNPEAGAYGGQIHGNFEVEPPPNFNKIASFLAIRELGSQPRLYEPEKLILPPSASWVVRKSVWLACVPECPSLGGRANGSMMQGDDYEPLLHMHGEGWEIWYNPAMEVNHQIPRQRLEATYLTSLSRGCGQSICHLRMINTPKGEKWKVLWDTLLGTELRRAVRFFVKNRHQLKTDLVTSCEMAFHWGRWESGWYFLKQNWL